MLLKEIFDDEMTDWRAWIDPTGTVHEIPRDETHAEWAYYRELDAGTAEDEDDEAGTEAAFANAMDGGWIRVGLNPHQLILYMTFSGTVSPQAMNALIKLIDRQHASGYVIDHDGKFVEFEDARQAKRHLRQILAKRGIKESRLMETDYEYYRSRINRLLQLLRQHPEADRIYVVGSLAKGKAQPRDLDVYVNLEDQSNDEKRLRPFNILLSWGQARFQRAEGLFDPFVGFKNVMLVRNPDSTAWAVAKGARDLRREFHRDGVPVKDVPDLT